MAKAKYTYDSTRKEWSTKVWDGTYTADGLKHRKKISSKKSSRDLEDKVNAFKAAVESKGATVYCNMTFGEYAMRWLEVSKGTREKNTQAMYRNVITVHLAEISGVPIDKIQHSHFLQVINQSSDRPRTCEQVYLTFKQIIRMAVQDRILTQNDLETITANISLPKRIKREKRPLTALEKDAIRKADFTLTEKLFISILYSCGLRREEILALTPFDFDFTTQEISINKVVIFDGNAPEIKESTKSDNGRRRVPFPQMPEYRDYILQSTPYVFRSGAGLMSKSAYVSFWQRIILKINAAAGGKNAYNSAKKKTEIVINMVPGLTAHIFRHNYCTELCYQVPSISIKKIAQLMGDTQKVVLDVYNHIVDEKEDAGAIVAKTLVI